MRKLRNGNKVRHTHSCTQNSAFIFPQPVFELQLSNDQLTNSVLPPFDIEDIQLLSLEIASYWR